VEQVTTLVQLLVNGVLIGLVFALVAVGLTLIYGVMNIVNFAHGELLMLAMYATFGLSLVGLEPILALPFAAIALFVFGLIVYRLVISRLLKGPPEAQMFGTFGMLVLFQGAAQALFSSDYFSVQNRPFQGALHLGPINIAEAALAEGVGALLLTGAVFWFIERTETGRAMRALAEDRVAAMLMGINVQRMNAIAFGLGAACAGAAGALLMLSYPVFPTIGGSFALTAFVVVSLGGFGSVAGALIAALIIGVVEVLSGFYLSPEVKMIPVYLSYLVVVLIRPTGLLGRR
jgi:branched-chain amino acid transport system permease protein